MKHSSFIYSKMLTITQDTIMRKVDNYSPAATKKAAWKIVAA